jgi:hypothetical protein
MDNFFLKETINKRRLLNIIQWGRIDDNERKQLRKYLKLMNQDNQVVVLYHKNLNIGRRYASKGLSLQMFSKSVRQSLTYDTHIDIDIVNCHLVLMSQYCSKNNIYSPHLNTFNSERNSKLQEIMTKCGVSRKVAKEFILTIMYLGDGDSYCVNNGFVSTPPSWVDDLIKEFKIIADIIIGLNEDISKQVNSLKKKEHKNKKASVMSYVLQIIEDDIIMNARNKLLEMEYEVETLCFDGLMVLKTEDTFTNLDDLNAYCFNKTGYNVEFEIKPMTNLLNITDEEDVCCSIDYNYEHTDYYDQDYHFSLKMDSDYKTYILRKQYFELFCCKVITPDACFVFQNGKDKDPNIYNTKQMSMVCQPVESGYISAMGNRIMFWDKWIIDPKQRVYRKYDFIPYNMIKADVDIFNMFLGMNEHIYGKPSENPQKMLKPYFDIVRELCGGIDKDADYLHKFFANIFQEPTKRPPTTIVIKGKQGTGKNLVLDAIGNMVDKIHYITTSNVKDLFGEHAEGFYRKLLVNLNEAEGKDTFDYEGKIKSFVTDDSITLNPKFVRPCQVSNHARLVITTNKETPIPIDVKSQDRRYVVYKTTEEYLKYSQSAWANLYNHFRKPVFMATLHTYYMGLDLNEFDWIKERPITKAYRDMCSLYVPTEALFFADYIENAKWIVIDPHEDTPIVDKNISIDVKCQDLFDSYCFYCKINKFYGDKSPNSRAFGGKLLGLNLPLYKHKGWDTNYWRFIPNEIYTFMELKRWINDFGDKDVKVVVGEEFDENYFD